MKIRVPKNKNRLRAREWNANFAGLTYTKRINFLKKVLELDSVNIEATYSLGEIYYELFIKEYNGNQKKANLDHYAKNATYYFTNFVSIDKRYLETAKFPLIQLAHYARDNKRIAALEKENIQSSYFPVIVFAGLPDNWRTDYSVNVINYFHGYSLCGVESAVFSINWYSKHLEALQEPVLNDSVQGQIYRFTYLRTFDNPIVIRIENKEGNISIYWKVSDGAGGYDPGKITINKSKELTIKEWELIENKINSIGFWELPAVYDDILGTDGSQWILEGKISEKYHVVDRWCGGEISSVCKELLELTDIKLAEDDIY